MALRLGEFSPLGLFDYFGQVFENDRIGPNIFGSFYTFMEKVA
jgi:hypothetical protein